jgi:hypothetical protein
MRWMLVLALVLVSAAAADAAVIVTDARPSVVYEPQPTVGGPALLDGRPVWGETDHDNRAHLVTVDATGARQVLASARHLYGDELAPVRTAVDAEGPYASLKASTDSCEACRDGAVIWDTAQIAGRTGAMRELPRGAGGLLAGGALVSAPKLDDLKRLFDLDSGATRDVTLPGTLAGAAGANIATRPDLDTLVVSDRDTGRERYRLTTRWSPLAMQPDGTILLSNLTVVSPDAPQQPRPVTRPVADDSPNGWAMRGNRIAWLSPREVVITDLAGAVLGRVPVREVVSGLGFDGETATWAQRPCAVGLVVTWKLGDPEPQVPSGPCPAARVRIARLTRRALTVDLACPADPGLGCPMVVTFGVRVRRRDRTVDVPLYGPGSEALAPGEHLRLRLPFVRKSARLLRRGAAARVTTYARVDRHRDDAGYPDDVRRLPRATRRMRIR